MAGIGVRGGIEDAALISSSANLIHEVFIKVSQSKKNKICKLPGHLRLPHVLKPNTTQQFTREIPIVTKKVRISDKCLEWQRPGEMGSGL